MITTNNTKVKERSQKDVLLTKITTGETKPKGFKVKGKPRELDPNIITTGNMVAYQEKRKKEKEIEDKATKIRKKNYDKEIEKVRETQRLKKQGKDATIEEQIKALDKKKKELQGMLGGQA